MKYSTEIFFDQQLMKEEDKQESEIILNKKFEALSISLKKREFNGLDHTACIKLSLAIDIKSNIIETYDITEEEYHQLVRNDFKPLIALKTTPQRNFRNYEWIDIKNLQVHHKYYQEGKKAWEGNNQTIFKTDNKAVTDFVYSSDLFKKVRETYNK